MAAGHEAGIGGLDAYYEYKNPNVSKSGFAFGCA